MRSSIRNRNGLRCASSVFALCTALAASAGWAAEYRFTPEPIYPADAAHEIYKPLLEYLGKATGNTFVLVSPQNYSTYWRDILKPGTTDFSYDEAHFADYRIEQARFIPLVRTSESTSYTLLADAEFENKGADALLGHSIATMPAPSLGYALLMQFYPNPVQQPKILSSASSWRDGVQIVFGGEASAAIVPTWLIGAYGYPNLVTIKTSRQFSGPAILASPDVPEEIRNQVRDALLKLGDEPQLAELLLQLGISKFVPAAAKDYAGDRLILSGFYGYR
jgi:hypothetical protein